MKNFTFVLCLLATLCGSFLSPAQEVKSGRAVQINITGVPVEEKGRIDGAYSVADDGTVNMPLIGKVPVAGMQAADASRKVADAYRDAGVFLSPQISLIAMMHICGPGKTMITVAGFVQKPGPKSFKPGITIFQAITDAGGVNEFGNMKRVNLMRDKTTETYNLNKVEHQKIELQVDDTIEVPTLFPSPVR